MEVVFVWEKKEKIDSLKQPQAKEGFVFQPILNFSICFIIAIR